MNAPDDPETNGLRIFGRSSSHYTRLVRIFAEEVGAPCAFSPIYDMTSLDPRDYGGHPAMKLPVLRTGGEAVFGALNICRALAERASTGGRIVWPEELTDTLGRNAQELVWHGMQTQVQIAFGTEVAALPADNVYFVKARAGLANALAWLEEAAPEVLAALPPRQVSLFEASLFCLVEHVAFRKTAPLEPYARLAAFVRAFGSRPSAQATPYRFDRPVLA